MIICDIVIPPFPGVTFGGADIFLWRANKFLVS